jgi:hypothetical protein
MDSTSRYKSFNRYGVFDALNQVLEGNMLKKQSHSEDLKRDLN